MSQLFESSVNPFEPVETVSIEDEPKAVTSLTQAPASPADDAAASPSDIPSTIDFQDPIVDSNNDVDANTNNKTSTTLPHHTPSPTAADALSDVSTSSAVATTASVHDVISPIRHALLPSARSSPPPPAPAPHVDNDGMLTPRSLARKIAAHHARYEDNDEADEGEDRTFDHPAFATAAENEDPNAPRYVAVVAGYKLKGDGLDMHTRYEIACKWKPSLVAASAAAIAAAKAKSHAGDDDQSSPVPTGPVTKIPPTSKVGRRFNDFVTLQGLLTQLYPSYLIPCLPPKGLLQRFDEEFIAMRQRGLQRFLFDLSRSPVLAEEKLLTDFLVAPTREWEAISASAQQLHHMGGTKEWLIKGTMSLTSKLLTSMGKSNVKPEAHTHDEHYLTSIESGIFHHQLQLQYDNLNSMFDHIVEQEKELADAWLQWYPAFEESDDSLQSSRIAHTHDLLGLDFAQFLPLTQRIGLFSMRKADIEAASISELLHHTAGMIHQLHDLFKRRQIVSQAVRQADTDVKKTTAQLEAMARRVQMGEKVRNKGGERGGGDVDERGREQEIAGGCHRSIC